MKVVITGGAGFIGSNLAARCVADGHETVVLDDLSTGHRRNIPEGATFVEGSILDERLLGEVFESCRYVYHQGALGSVPRSIKDPLRSHEVNATGTLKVLQAARAADVEKVVFAASSSAYGDTEVLPKVETMPANPMSPYAVTKTTAEHYIKVFHQVYGLRTTALRYFNVYGPRQAPNGPYAAVIPKFILAAMANEPLRINGDGTYSRDFTFVEDVVAANLLAADTTASDGEIINIGAGGRTTIQTLAEEIVRHTGSNAPIDHGPIRPGDVPHSLAGLDKARSLLGYAPQVPIEQGLGRTVQWFQAAYPVQPS